MLFIGIFLSTEITSGSEQEKKIISSCFGDVIWFQWNQFKKKNTK